MKNKENRTSIGGQAVIEGVMMRGKTSMATAVRDEDGIIRLESKRFKRKKKSVVSKIPILRGVIAFGQSLFGGMKVLMRSAEVYGEAEPSRFEKWLAKKLKIDVLSIILTLSMILGVALALFLFIYLPIEARKLLENLFGTNFNVWGKNIIEGGLKLLIFILYVLLCSLIKDVRRTFMYHGAEHKTITCFESGLDLTVDNAKKCKRVHDRCGTTFIVFVLIISILSFAVLESVFSVYNLEIEKYLRILLKIALLPLVAGLSYELLKGLSKTDCFIFYPLKVPGILLQKITTKEPDDDMIEVAITAFNKVIEMDNDQSIEEVTFITAEKTNALVERVYKTLKDNGIEERAEAEWIVSLTVNVKRDEINTEKFVRPIMIEKINKIVDERITGRPLWYCLGDTEFYGYKIKVDERVLIPRPETELLAEQVINLCKDGYNVLDLCTGSGAIAITVKKQTNANVFASDISQDALSLAKENAVLNDAKVEFIQSDLFENIQGEFDVIVSNPPYIKSEDIKGLQVEVKDFEPIMALDGGVDGYDFYKKISSKAKYYLKKGGVLLLECGIGQAQDIKQMLTDFTSVEIIKDFENIERIVKAVY